MCGVLAGNSALAKKNTNLLAWQAPMLSCSRRPRHMLKVKAPFKHTLQRAGAIPAAQLNAEVLCRLQVLFLGITLTKCSTSFNKADTLFKEQQAGCPAVSLSVNELLWNANFLRDRPSHKRIQVSALVVLLWMLLACLASWPGCSASSLYMAM